MAFILAVAAILTVLISTEIWWRKYESNEEFSRKFVHIVVGSFVATWPFFLTWPQIEFLSAAFVLVVLISKYLGMFEAIHSVQRPTWGELFFAVAGGVVALITHDKWIYAASLLQMSLADGMAAVIGTRFGKKQRYLVLGHAKSVAGSLTFLLVSLLIFISFRQVISPPLSWGLIGSLSLLATALENIGIRGLDNLLVPLIVALILANR